MTSDPLTVLREGLHVLYAYTSDAANPPGGGRSETHAQCRAALADVEALIEAGRFAVHSIDPNATLPRKTLEEALARFPATSPAKERA